MSEPRKQLFKVNLIGFSDFYVIAEDANSAYLKVKEDLDNLDYGFAKNRQLKSVELLAEDYAMTTISRLYL